ncbi:MAG: aldo/keto reductase [Ilumatobacteraceae bacterium]
MTADLPADRYARMTYRRSGASGLTLPAVSLGAWETYGASHGEDVAADCIRTAFDLGINHFDFADNYGNPPGNAELMCGAILRQLPRDEILISTKAGYPMWPGPTGDGGSLKHLIASCDQSLARLGVDYVDVFYHHRPDPNTPVEESMGALATLVRSGKALYAGVSSYTGEQFEAAAAAAAAEGLRLTIHQPYYNLLGRTVETDLLDRAASRGTGVIAFCPLASGLLTDKYLDGEVPAGARGTIWPGRWVRSHTVDERRVILSGLNEIAAARGQTLAQMAIAWILRDQRITAVVAGATKAEQVCLNVAALDRLDFEAGELAAIDALTLEQAT